VTCHPAGPVCAPATQQHQTLLGLTSSYPTPAAQALVAPVLSLFVLQVLVVEGSCWGVQLPHPWQLLVHLLLVAVVSAVLVCAGAAAAVAAAALLAERHAAGKVDHLYS